MIKRFLICILWSTALSAQSGGSTVFSFLDRSIFAGSSALANTAYLNSSAVGAYALQNPLLLTDSSMYQLEASYGTLGEGIQALQSTYGFKIGGIPMVAGVQNISYGEFMGTDSWGNPQGAFTAGDLSISLGASLFQFKGWSFGSTVKVVSGTYESYQSWAIATDFVAMNRFENGPDVAIMVKNFGTQLTAFSSVRESLPTNVLVAVGDRLKYAPFRWTFVVDQLQRPNLGYDDPNNATVDPISGEVQIEPQSLSNLALRHLGGSLEFLATERAHFMLGYNFRRQFEMALPTRRTSGGFTLGAGLYFNKFSLHYANELRSVAGRMNTLSLGLNL